jgi:hypothetical protein
MDVDDMTNLEDLTEESILQNLQGRYQNKKIYVTLKALHLVWCAAFLTTQHLRTDLHGIHFGGDESVCRDGHL